MSAPEWTPKVGDVVGQVCSGRVDDASLARVVRVRSPTRVDVLMVGAAYDRRSYRHREGAWIHLQWSWDQLVRLGPDDIQGIRYRRETRDLRHTAREALDRASPEAVRECARILGLEVTT